ncbi:Cyanovirin-N [Lojkania enalia]|uniref:Cyanovirin-N n=1 Tax=Lojkania enalia TaxID=147567 RepID=A0A9P4N2B4_9PLEO|nr:Cyanovirin-N [Didymosphaeria enalia]
MFYKALLSLIVLAWTTVNAAPHAARSISSECINVRLTNWWLVANCLTGQDSSTRIESSVYLPNKITNTEGTLEWKINGLFAATCNDCTILDSSKLNCQCRPTAGQRKNTTLDLNEHIRNYNGHLLNDLSGPPTIPKTSPINMPSDLSWALYLGGFSCYAPSNPEICGSSSPQDLTCPSNAAVSSSTGSPSYCFQYRLPVSTPVWYKWNSMKAEAPGMAYEFLLYDNLDCAGKPFRAMEPSEFGMCENLGRSALAVQVRPLWNADS